MKIYELVNLIDAATEEELKTAKLTARSTIHSIQSECGECPRGHLYQALLDACEARLDDIRENRATE